KGLKTGMYYLRTQAATQAVQFTVDKQKEVVMDDRNIVAAGTSQIMGSDVEPTSSDGPACSMQDGCISCGS
ncbi:MAG TPA: hypothetical protein DHW64_12780, partial [Chitinophagaceae bacterium]|nr:hypothetical protein [Chitinophagaceae bacterium]